MNYHPSALELHIDTIQHTDALSLLAALPAQSVDMVLCDPPYGVTANHWDTVIPFAPMWSGIRRVLKPRGVCALTASQPFTSLLIMSNLEWFRYELIWEKSNGVNFLNAPYQPLKVHEEVLLFSAYASTHSKRGTMRYYPQMEMAEPYLRKSSRDIKPGRNTWHSTIKDQPTRRSDGERMPRSVLFFQEEKGLHPTQKPVALFEYLIRTYTQPSDTVLDFCMGSGTTAVAARNLDRHFIGCDTSVEYVVLARERLRNTDPYQSRKAAPGIEQPSLFGNI